MTFDDVIFDKVIKPRPNERTETERQLFKYLIVSLCFQRGGGCTNKFEELSFEETIEEMHSKLKGLFAPLTGTLKGGRERETEIERQR